MSQCYRTSATHTGFAQPRYTAPAEGPRCTVSAPYTKRAFSPCGRTSTPYASYSTRSAYPNYSAAYANHFTRPAFPRPVCNPYPSSYDPYYAPYAHSRVYTHYSTPVDTACAVGALGAVLFTAAFLSVL